MNTSHVIIMPCATCSHKVVTVMNSDTFLRELFLWLRVGSYGVLCLKLKILTIENIEISNLPLGYILLLSGMSLTRNHLLDSTLNPNNANEIFDTLQSNFLFEYTLKKFTCFGTFSLLFTKSGFLNKFIIFYLNVTKVILCFLM